MQDRRLERGYVQQVALAEFSKFALVERDINKILSEGARICSDIFAAQYCKIMQYNSVSNDLHIVAGCGWRDDLSDHIVPIEAETIDACAFRQNAIVFCESLDSPHNTYAKSGAYATYGIVTAIAVVLPSANIAETPFGILEIASTTKRRFKANDAIVLQTFGNIIGHSISSNYAIQKLRLSIEDRDGLLLQKESLLQELHHRVRNNLQLVYGLLLDSARVPVEITTETVARRVLGLARVYDHLLMDQRGPYMVAFGAYLNSLCEQLHVALHEKRIRVMCNADEVFLPLEIATAIGMAVNELMMTSAIYTEEGGSISVRLIATDDSVQMTIQDSGNYDGEGGESKRSGIGLVRRLIRQIKADIDIHTGRCGRIAIIKLPCVAAIFPVCKSTSHGLVTSL